MKPAGPICKIIKCYRTPKKIIRKSKRIYIRKYKFALGPRIGIPVWLGLDFRCIFRPKLHRKDNSGPALAAPGRPSLGWLAQGPPLAPPCAGWRRGRPWPPLTGAGTGWRSVGLRPSWPPRSPPDPSQIPFRSLPDPSQIPPRSFPDPFQIPPRSFPDFSQIPPRSFPDPFHIPPRSLPDPAQISPKSFPNPYQIRPRSLPDPSQILPRFLPDPSQIPRPNDVPGQSRPASALGRPPD